MTDYTYCVSLSITHPTITPDEITKAINIEPSCTAKFGEQRKSAQGKALDGKNRENYWRFTPHTENRLSGDDIQLEDYLDLLNKQFAPHQEYFNSLVKSGGYIEYFIGWFEGDHNLITTFSPSLLKSTAELSIAIGIDAYAN
jgi:hypothetical protein